MVNTISNERDLVILDFDGTIIRANSFNLFIKFLYKKYFTFHNLYNLLSSAFLRKFRLISSLKFKNRILSVLKGKDSVELQHIFSDFVQLLIPHLRNDALRKIEFHKKDNASILIISGAIYEYLHLLNDILNVDEIFATKLAYQSGICTGEVDGVEVLGDAKAAILRDYFLNNRRNFRSIFCYTDSLSDLPILELADVKVIINKKKYTINNKGLVSEIWS